MTHPIILIPARLASTRLPNKPLAMIGDAPMIVQVWRRASGFRIQDSGFSAEHPTESKPVPAQAGSEAAIAGGLGRQPQEIRRVVACDSAEIKAAIEAAGGEAVLTDPDLPSGSDRIWAALQQVDAQKQHDVIINLQGDMPTLDPAIIAAVLKPLENPAVEIATLAAVIHTEEERHNPAVVKIALAAGEGARRALYFSRALIPTGADTHYHHIGIYAYRRSALERFVALPPSPLEQAEKLEQLRALEAGMRIDVAIVDTVPLGVDTPEQLETARALLSKS